METPLRSRILNNDPHQAGAVIYWMQRDMRIHDNWALLSALKTAQENQSPFAIVVLDSMAEGGQARLSSRILNYRRAGLVRVLNDAKANHLPFYCLENDEGATLRDWIIRHEVKHVVTDFSPLREFRQRTQALADAHVARVTEVDAHNIVPWFIASHKQEWGAYTLRPKIHRLLPTYLVPFPQLTSFHVSPLTANTPLPDWFQHVTPLEDPLLALQAFITHGLTKYAERNDPNAEATSRLSAAFHFGHLATQTVALAVKKSPHDVESFLEEMIVRKELADNFCAYNDAYDTFLGFPDWAKKTLDAHRRDTRAYLYDVQSFADGKTHDDAWNAAQLQMVKTGYMHGYMRMYWAKKILEWTASPEEALRIANTLNDTFELDGRDPNGYTGTAWAIGGVHDRPWQERPIFGMIRFMNAQGLKRKFDIGQYIRTWTGVHVIPSP